MYLFTCSINGTPVTQGSMKAFVVKGRPIVTHSNSKLNSWKKYVHETVKICHNRPLLVSGLSVELFFRLTDRAIRHNYHDLDKYVRAILDSMTGAVYYDDAQILEIHAVKLLKCDNPGVDIYISEYNLMNSTS